MEKAPDFNLDIQDPEKMERDELINNIESIVDLEVLQDLAFNNPEVGRIYNPLRFYHLSNEIDGFSDDFSGLDESGYLLDASEARTSDHVTQIDHTATDQTFLQEAKLKLKAEL
jgi:hypothetical protein